MKTDGVLDFSRGFGVRIARHDFGEATAGWSCTVGLNVDQLHISEQLGMLSAADHAASFQHDNARDEPQDAVRERVGNNKRHSIADERFERLVNQPLAQ